MNRIWIIGCSGSGKSTLADRLAAQLDLTKYELDGIFHQSGWTQMPDEQFCARLAEIVGTERWILDGNYFRRCPGTIAARAELVVWLDLARAQTFFRVVRRSLRGCSTAKNCGTEIAKGGAHSLIQILRRTLCFGPGGNMRSIVGGTNARSRKINLATRK